MVKIKHVKELKIKATDTYGSENVRTIRVGDYLLIDVGYGMQSYAVNNIVYTKDNMFSTYIELVSEDGTTLVFQWYKLVETIFAFDINIFITEMSCEYNEYDVLIGDRIIDIIRIGDYVDYDGFDGNPVKHVIVSSISISDGNYKIELSNTKKGPVIKAIEGIMEFENTSNNINGTMRKCQK